MSKLSKTYKHMAPNDNHFPSSKPPSLPTAPPPPPIPNGSSTNSKPNPIPPRHPIRQQLYSDSRNQHQQQRRQQRWQRPSNRRICCCCCFWSILLLLITLLIASLLAIGLYAVYQPRPPSFTVASLRIHRFNLTASPDSSAARLSSLFNLTLITKNPNSQFVFGYEPLLLSVVTDPDEILLGNGTVAAFSSGEKNVTSFRGVAVASTEARELDFGDGLGLKTDLKRKKGLDLKVMVDTKVEIRMGKLKSKRVGIRVSCGEIRGELPKGKAVTVASTDKSKCKVDLRIKIWNWTF
ncbi:unnamed protein product [Eruca vesicaria subsp. sativa]|uniref:Late embryogenesis abundant protein LEA-2 subgroup domain-containing protein n=1 Tax=Eruca vesicaria subsp. sativa TaxID=29727 RepID=A0ABC8JZK7_ERUVS|nr:unnamed protein product [Eruca vesicaria subsp. sativa]